MKSKNLLLRLLAFALIIVVGLVLLLTVGFNKSVDLTGYHLIEVNIAENTISEAKTKIDNVLETKNINIHSHSIEENDYGTVIVVKFTTKLSNTSVLESSIKEELVSAFGYDQTSLIEQTYVKVSGLIQPESMLITFLGAGLAILIGLIAITFYLALRYNFTTALMLFISVALDVLMALALTLIFRLPITSHFGIAIVGTAIFSIILNILFYNKLIENTIDEKFAKSSNVELVKHTQSSFVNNLVLISLACLIGVSAFAFFNLSTSISLALGFVATLYTSQILIPYIWATVYTRKAKSKKVQKEEVKEEV